MIRRLLLGVALCLAAISVQAQTCTPRVADTELVKPHTLVMATNPTLPPMQFVNQAGELVGMRIDLGAAIAKKLCLTAEFVKVEFAAMIPGLAAQRWDMIDTGMFFTADRAKIVQLVRYENQAISVSVARGNPLKITKLEDLAGRPVGVEQGGFEFQRTRDMSAEIVAKGGKPLDIRPFDNFALAFQALRAGQVDAAVSIDSTAKEYDTRGDFTRALSGMYGTPIAFGLRSKALATQVAAALTELRADGSFAKLLDQYGVQAWSGAFDVVGPESPGLIPGRAPLALGLFLRLPVQRLPARRRAGHHLADRGVAGVRPGARRGAGGHAPVGRACAGGHRRRLCVAVPRHAAAGAVAHDLHGAAVGRHPFQRHHRRPARLVAERGSLSQRNRPRRHPGGPGRAAPGGGGAGAVAGAKVSAW